MRRNGEGRIGTVESPIRWRAKRDARAVSTHVDRRGVERGRILTGGQIDEQARIREAMFRYHQAERERQAQVRRRVWRRIRWACLVALGIGLLVCLVIFVLGCAGREPSSSGDHHRGPQVKCTFIQLGSQTGPQMRRICCEGNRCSYQD